MRYREFLNMWVSCVGFSVTWVLAIFVQARDFHERVVCCFSDDKQQVAFASTDKPAPPAPAPNNIGNAEFPRIESNLGVTFRLKATEARTVLLGGGEGLVADPLPMTRLDDGTWTLTTPPAVPGFHYYWFIVDGLRVNDPAGYSYFGWGRESSGVEIPEAGVDFYQRQSGIPQGTIRTHWYESGITDRWRRAHVYTPSEYDSESAIRYPVLYILHGAGENERSWVEQGRLQSILDNLIAARKAVPMIVVADSGYASTRTPSDTSRNAATAAFEDVLLRELIPSVDRHFRTRPNRESRAMAGLSMGGSQTLSIGLKHHESFAWIAAMSAPPRDEFDATTAYDGVFADAAAFNSRVKLLWIGAGTAEPRFHQSSLAMHDALKELGIDCHYFSSEGTGHEWQTWRRSLHDLAPRLFSPNEDMLPTTDEPVPGAATPEIPLEYPKITRVTGTVVKRRNLMKMYEYYMITQDGLIYALAIQDPPQGGLDKSYDAIGVRMVTTAEYSRQLEQRAKESLLPGQTIPPNPVEDTLLDVTLSPHVE